MKAKSRRRLLISSVAMLLVAMLALGTATFAWFTSNPNATAQGLSLKATAAKGLVIQTSTHGAVDSDFWGHSDFLNYVADADGSGHAGTSTTPINLAASSFDVTGDFTGGFTVDAADDDNYAPAENATVGASSANDYYQETIKCKLTGGETASDTDTVVLTGVTVTNRNQDLSPTIRVAIQYTAGSTTTLLGVYAPAAASNKYLTNTGDYEDALSSSNYSFKALSTISNADLGIVESTGANYITVTVYLDGEDAACKTTNISLSELLSSLTLNLKLKSANA